MAESPAPGFPIWFPFLFVGMWAAANFIFAERSGWRLLGQKYKLALNRMASDSGGKSTVSEAFLRMA
jgi:hypothetical protein